MNCRQCAHALEDKPYNLEVTLCYKLRENTDIIERYTKILNSNPTDIVVMGIGENGHIAFNDPWVAKFESNNSASMKSIQFLAIKNHYGQVHR